MIFGTPITHTDDVGNQFHGHIVDVVDSNTLKVLTANKAESPIVRLVKVVEAKVPAWLTAPLQPFKADLVAFVHQEIAALEARVVAFVRDELAKLGKG